MQENNGSNQKQGGLSWSTPSSAQSTPAKTPAAAPIKTAAPAPAKAAPAKSAAQEKSSAARYAGMVVLGVVAGALIAWGYSSWHRSAKMTADTTSLGDTKGETVANNNSTSSSDKDLGVNMAGATAVGSDASFTIPSPQAAGTSVAVAKAVVAAPTWVVIYENNDGKPGNALGAALFFPDHQTGTVELLRSTTPGRSYLAVKQVDNGDRKFSLKDDQYLSEGGSVQWVTFQAK